MRDFNAETQKRIAFIRQTVANAGAAGVVLGLSGGKDSALAAYLCSLAGVRTVGVIMPCQSKVNYTSDADHARLVAAKLNIELATMDLTAAKAALESALAAHKKPITADAAKNISPRLRMAALYALAQTENLLVCGTSNASELYVGYFTKWGDGGADFNPISDLFATEVFDYLRHLGCPREIIEKPPSAGLFEGQTDEGELGVTYAQIEAVMQGAAVAANVPKVAVEKIEKMHARTAHKRGGVLHYGEKKWL